MAKKQRPEDRWLVTITARKGDGAVETTFALGEEQYLQFEQTLRHFLQDKPFLSRCPQPPADPAAGAAESETALAPSSPPGPTRIVNIIRLKR